MASYQSRVRADIARWIEVGLVDAETGAKLAQDVEAHAGRAISFGAILATLAALLFGAALLVFVSADWDAMPREVRTIGLGTLVAALLAAGVTLKRRGEAGLGEALLLAAAAAWGGTLVLVAEMYALEGDGSNVALIWCLGTAAAAGILRSPSLTVGAAALAGAWMLFEGLSFWEHGRFPYLYPLLAAGIWAVSLRSDSAASRNLLMLTLTGYGLLLSFRQDALTVGIAMIAIGAMLFLVAARDPARMEALLRLSGNAPYHFMLAALAGLALVQLELADDAGFALSAAAAIVAICGALVVGGRSSRGVRRLCYVAFALEIGLVLAVTLGTMMDTAAFFFAAALLLAAMAVLILRLERRLAVAAPAPSA